MSFTIAHLSDAHLSPAPFPPLIEFRLKRFMGFVNWKRARQRINDMPMLERLVADMRAQKPDHIAMTGDIVNLALTSEFDRAAEWLGALGDPQHVSFTPGNHDAYVRQAMPVLKRTFAPWTEGEDTFPYLKVRGEVAIIGLSSGVPTAPIFASGRVGAKQLAAFAKLLQETGARGLARVVLIHHPPLAVSRFHYLRGLDDHVELQRVVADHGAEIILHGHTHKRMRHALPSRASRLEGGKALVLGVSSCSTAQQDHAHRAAYQWIRLTRAGGVWRVEVRMRGPTPDGKIGEDP